MQNLRHIIQLGIKELLSLARDPVLLFLIVYSFTFSVYTPAKSAVMDVVNASVAVVDEDDSEASRRIPDALLPPLFLPAVKIAVQRDQSGDERRALYVHHRHPAEVSVRPLEGRRTDGRNHSGCHRDESGGPRAGVHQAKSSSRSRSRFGADRGNPRESRSWSNSTPAPDSIRICSKAGSSRSTRSSTTFPCSRSS